MKNAGNFCKFLILYDKFVRAMFAVFKCITCMVSELRRLVLYVGATERMNLCQALTSAMDITLEKDSTAGEIVNRLNCVHCCLLVSCITDVTAIETRA